jgi:hypothetical protein
MGALLSPGSLSSAEVLGVSGGEVGGSAGGMGFSAAGEGARSMVDSKEEMFDEIEAKLSTAQEKVAVRLVFPLLTGQIGLEEQWLWNVCGGLIGGARGNHFCTKPVKDRRYSHCGVGSHTLHKANLEEGHGYIPSMTDRSNTESAFLEPSVNAARFPGAFTEVLGQSLSHDEWLASFTVLPTVEEMDKSTEVGHELMTEVTECQAYIYTFCRLNIICPVRRSQPNQVNLPILADSSFGSPPTSKADASYDG